MLNVIELLNCGGKINKNKKRNSYRLGVLAMKSPNYRFSIITVFTALTVLAFALVVNVQADVIVCFTLDTDPGWDITPGSEWAFGTPTGQGGSEYGYPDPTSGATGVNVYGINLNGDYWPAIGGPYYLTAGPLDFTDFQNVELRFQRWLNTDYQPYVYATIEVSNDGANWVEIWDNGTDFIEDSSWNLYQYDISAVADDQQTVHVRWRHEVGDYGAYAFSGWNIDDICFLGNPINYLRITPEEDFFSSGDVGGPFILPCKTYMLTNDGSNPLDWTATKTQTWLDVTPAGGTLASGASATMRVCINAYADTLPIGHYTDTVTFSNLTSGISKMRNVTLLVGCVALMPFVEDFEGGPVLNPYWEITGTNEYRTQVTMLNGPHGGSYHLTMDDTFDNSLYSRNELTLAINLNNYENVLLTFWTRDFSDEPDGPPPIPFTGGYDFDGVAISEDGYYWYEVQGLRDISSTYMQLIVDLDAAIAAYGLTYNSTFRIRFNQYDNYSIPTDGIAIDDIEITGKLKDYLSITPSTGLVSSGYERGPFNPSSECYTLTNVGHSSLDWVVESSVSWLDIEPNSGTLLPYDLNVVEVFFNADANALPIGQYNGTVTFTNTTTGFIQTRPVALEVIPIPGEIEVTDTIPPPNDINMPFGEVLISLSRREHITITNIDPNHNLLVSDIFISREVIEGFEDGDIAEYTILGGTHSVTGAAAHNGQYGLESEGTGSSWIYRTDAAVQLSQGDTVSFWVKMRAIGRAYCGFGASANGTYSIVAASNSDNLLLQLNQNYGYFSIGTSPQAWTLDKWYRMEVKWDVGGNMTGRLYDSDGTTLLNTVTATDNTYTSGGIAFRAFDGSGIVADYFDTVERRISGSFTARELIASRLSSSANIATHNPADAIGWDEDNQSPIFRKLEVSKYPHSDGHSREAVLTGLVEPACAFRLENAPVLPAAVPPLGSITFDVIFEPPGIEEYESTVVIISSDIDEPNVVVHLSGSAIPDYIVVMPEEAFEFSGHPGGPFIPSNTSYQLTNSGPVTVDWVAEANVPWLDVSRSSGTLDPCESATITIMPNAQARDMNEGYYCGDLIVTDITTTLELRRRVCLNVHTDPKIWVTPYYFNVTVPQGYTQTETLTIGNGGDTDLNFSLGSRETHSYLPAAKTAVAGIETGEDKIVLEYEFNEPAVYKDNRYDWVRMEGLQQYERVGAPIIPVLPVKILVPFGKEVLTTQTIPLETYDLSDSYWLAPAQKPYPLSYQGTVQLTEPNMAIYGQAKPWPGINYEQVTTQSKRGYHVLTANLFPLQYVPATGKISYTSKLRLEIELADSISTNIVRPSTEVTSVLKAMVDNPNVLMTYPAEEKSVQKPGNPAALPSGGPYQYVIITSEALEAAPAPWNFQALRDAKIAGGMTATIVTIEWTYTNYDGTRPDGGSDNQTRIRNFLIDAYQTWGTEYVLLGGNANIIPARMFLVDSLVGDIYEMPVDMYYGCVEPQDCTFDYNADGYYGEPTDGVGGGDVDLLAEIYIGRAAVENAAELENFVKKTLAYDLIQNEYLSRIAMLGEYLGFGGASEYAKDSKEQIRLGGTYDGYYTCGFEDHNQPSFIDFNTIGCLPDASTCCWPLYDKDATWPKSKLICLMNGGVHVFNHLGHANETYCMKLYTSDLSSLINTDYFFVYSQGCYPGAFDTSNCFAEVITSMEHGAFAAIMNARYGYGEYNSTNGPSQRYDRQFWDAVLGEGMLEVGRANQDSKEDNLWNINGGCMRWCYYELNLFGDPAQKFRFAGTCDWIEFEPRDGTVPPGQAVDVNVIFIGEKPGGTYYGEVIVNSDDPYTHKVTIPVTMTIELFDYFTELFTYEYPFDPNDPNRNDMAYKSLTLTPDGSAGYYHPCTREATVFPVDPNGGIIISLNDDDYIPVSLDGEQIDFYGTNYEILYIGSNGYITFISGDTSYLESFEKHFELPRISALFDDLTPSAGGTVSYKLLSDRFAVTFENVPEYSLSNSNSFQIEIFFNDTIRLTWLRIDAGDGLAGVSEGYGVPQDFVESDLSEYCLVADLDSDCDTDFVDYALLASHWRFPDCNAQNDWCLGTDINKDGRTDFQDLALFTEYWLDGVGLPHD